LAAILTISPGSPEPERIAHAATAIRSGAVIAIPTDTVYGLAADPYDEAAVAEVFAVKQRPAESALLLLVDSLAMALGCAADPSPHFLELAERFWPGPLTIVVPASARLPAAVTAGTGTIGLRHPLASIATAIIAQVGGPITATSANRSGQPDCRTAEEVSRQIGDRLPLIVDGGPAGEVKPSTVVRITGRHPEILREGAVGRARLEAFFREKGW